MTGQQFTAGPAQVTVLPVQGMPEITAGADLTALIADAGLAGPGLIDGDILVITSKIVSKAEGRVVRGDRESAIGAETVRVVARRGPTTISQTRHGLVHGGGRRRRVEHRARHPGAAARSIRTARPRRLRKGWRAGWCPDRRDHHRHDGPAVAGWPDRHRDRGGRR